MLRLLVLILILVNGVYFAWADGMLRAYGFAPTQQSEPQRLNQQIRPEAMRLLNPGETKRVDALAQADLVAKECLQAGPFDDAQVATLRRALESMLAPGTWQIESVMVPVRWIVYMGKFADAEGLAKKRAELTAINVDSHAVNNPTLDIGLSLGSFDSQAAATAELNRLSQRGIRTARVVQESGGGVMSELKLPALTQEMKARLNDLKPALAGRSLKGCG